MNLLTVGCVVLLQLLPVFSAPYVKQNYSSRDCHGLLCPENTLKCVKDSAITENRDAMRSLISCVGRGGSILLSRSILEPVEKDGPIFIHLVTTVIEVDLKHSIRANISNNV